MALVLHDDGALRAGDTVLFAQLPASVSLEADPHGIGGILRATAASPDALHEFPLGAMPAGRRFACCHRYEPYWMLPKAGAALRDVPMETQFLMVELADDRVAILLPLLDGWFRCSLAGLPDDRLLLRAETGDQGTVGRSVAGLLVAVGADPYALMAQVAASALARMQTGRLRTEKPLPPLAELFAWCTWDAFYREVSADKVREGLASFRAGGVSPAAVILDDGWLTVKDHGPPVRERLTAFTANERFPDDLAPLIRSAKAEYGVRQFLVWHALCGYWGGVDREAFPEYRIEATPRRFSGPVRATWPTWDAEWWSKLVGLVQPESIAAFFNDFHRHLRQQGVDGVKVDCQAILEGLAEGLGGRVELTRAYHEALEGSAQTHFLGNLINCMSCANEMIFSTLNSTLLRTSTDFWPDRPETHGLHLHTNALVSFWAGEFIHPDWDMFQSGHRMGAFHAAGRAVGGCPVYVSDKPDGHDFGVLRKLVLSDGTTLRAQLPGRPTRDCLFRQPQVEDVPLKIFNRNRYGGVIGAFNCRYVAGAEVQPSVIGELRPGDVEGLAGDRFAVHVHGTGTTVVLDRDATLPIHLGPAGYEVYTIMPIEDGFAPLGLTDKFNSGAAVSDCRRHGGSILLRLRDGGAFAAWCERPPQAVLVNGQATSFACRDQCLRLDLPVGQPCEVELRVTAQ